MTMAKALGDISFGVKGKDGETRTFDIPAGKTFDPGKLGMSAEQLDELIAAGAASKDNDAEAAPVPQAFHEISGLAGGTQSANPPEEDKG